MTTLDEFGEVLTVRELARVLRVDKDGLYAAIHRGEIPHFAVGRSIRIPRVAIERLLGADANSGSDVGDAKASAARRRGEGHATEQI